MDFHAHLKSLTASALGQTEATLTGEQWSVVSAIRAPPHTASERLLSKNEPRTVCPVLVPLPLCSQTYCDNNGSRFRLLFLLTCPCGRPRILITTSQRFSRISPVILPIFPSKRVPTNPATCAPRLIPMRWKSSSLHPCFCWMRSGSINQSIDQSINRSIGRSVGRSVNQSTWSILTII